MIEHISDRARVFADVHAHETQDKLNLEAENNAVVEAHLHWQRRKPAEVSEKRKTTKSSILLVWSNKHSTWLEQILAQSREEEHDEAEIVHDSIVIVFAFYFALFFPAIPPSALSCSVCHDKT